LLDTSLRLDVSKVFTGSGIEDAFMGIVIEFIYIQHTLIHGFTLGLPYNGV
jgi:hypothetical protein